KQHWDTPMFAEHWDFPQLFNGIIPYAIASNCDEVKLFHNGKEYIIPMPAECPNKFISGFLPYDPGRIEVIGYNNGTQVCSRILETPSVAYKLEFDDPSISIPATKGYET